jgi:hypothetical protein
MVRRINRAAAAAVGLFSIKSNTKASSNTNRELFCLSVSEKKLRGRWRVPGGLSAYAHEPAQQSPRRKKPKPNLRK